MSNYVFFKCVTEPQIQLSFFGLKSYDAFTQFSQFYYLSAFAKKFFPEMKERIYFCKYELLINAEV